MLRLAADVMSGPTGLAAALRTSHLADSPGGTRSLPLKIPIPLDTGQAKPTIPANLIRALLSCHRHCAFPGCRVPARERDIHHLTARSHGGTTTLENLAPLCPFHHLTVIHRWRRTLQLHPDRTTTATSPHGRTLSDHDPPQQAA
jgi:HNH endonuclease